MNTIICDICNQYVDTVKVDHYDLCSKCRPMYYKILESVAEEIVKKEQFFSSNERLIMSVVRLAVGNSGEQGDIILKNLIEEYDKFKSK